MLLIFLCWTLDSCDLKRKSKLQCVAPCEACQAHKSSAPQLMKASAGLHLCACLSLPMRLLVQRSAMQCNAMRCNCDARYLPIIVKQERSIGSKPQEAHLPDSGGCVGPEMRQVGGPSSSGQQRNMTLCSQLQEVHRSLLTLLPRMQPPAAAALMYAYPHLVAGHCITLTCPKFTPALLFASDCCTLAHLRCH